MNFRDTILQNVRNNQPAPRELPVVPAFHSGQPADLNCSAVPEYAGKSRPEDFSRWPDASDIDVTIVRSPLGVAETGSVLLSEEEFSVNTIGVLAHGIVILLDPPEIVENLHTAYAHPRFREKAYTLLISGRVQARRILKESPVHPAEGVMTLTVIFWPRTKTEQHKQS